MKKISTIALLIFLLLIYIFISAQNYVLAVTADLSESVFRLHIIANSNSEKDQKLKLEVRNSLLDYMNNICASCKTKEEAMYIANKHKSDFQNIAEQTIKNNGYNYSVKINIDNFYFPTKNYGDISLPSGMYDALRVEIGEAKGQNWWCVMFPSLCFVDISSGIVDNESKQNLEQNLEDESFSIISHTEKSNFKFKFKIIEFFAKNDLREIAKNK